MFRFCLLSALFSVFAFSASAKYCIKLPSCEDLGYVFKHKEGRREIRCPFDPEKVLYLDYCQAYGLSQPRTVNIGGEEKLPGEYEECIETKADGSKINTGYYRYIRCNPGFVYENGDCKRSD